jgi:hypothetical protein
MKSYYAAIIALLSFHSVGQLNNGLNPIERAYLFHIVKKSPILNKNMGRYFDYQGPIINLPNNTLNYDSIELLIINQPDLLIIRKGEIAKSPKGLIAEAANKMALWELNKLLLSKRNSKKNYDAQKLELFETFLNEKLPKAAYRQNESAIEPHPKIYNCLNPSLSLDEKILYINSLRFLSADEQRLTLDAISYAINKYVELRALETYLSLGGKTEYFTNILIAAGDGSNTSGLLQEREKDEHGRWNKGLPKAVGLFPYQLITTSTDKKVKTIEPERCARQTLKTAGLNRLTNIHLDVWGYNSKKQTTVVIEKNGLHYHLFGSGESRFLTPDSSFNSGATFQSIINDLEFDKIAKWNNKIDGKHGIDNRIMRLEKQKSETEIKIKNKEKEYSDLGYIPLKSNKKQTRKVARKRKKALKKKSGNYELILTSKAQRSERKKIQHQLIELNSAYTRYSQRIIDLIQEKKNATDKRAVLQARLDCYKDIMGYRWAAFKEKDGLFVFEDSSTFDSYTQEFQFKPSEKPEEFEVRLVAIPESSISTSADEVMLHINVMDAKPDYNARIKLKLNDVFPSDEWKLKQELFNATDSVSVHVFFEALLNKKLKFNIVARGRGIGKWNGNRIIKDDTPNELNQYPGDPKYSKMDTSFVRLRYSEVIVYINRSIHLEINSYTDPIKSNLLISNVHIQEAMSKYRLSKNDILSAYRTAELMNALSQEISIRAGTYLTRENAKLVIDRFNKAIEKTRIYVGRTSFKLNDLK